jgi:multidrug efflux pump subunit AcrA (membrane-fusion protein)
VAEQDAETQETAYKSALAIVAAQESTVRANQDNVTQAQANLDRVIALQEFKNVRSPIDGVVTARNVDVGYLISSTGGSLGASPSTQPGAALNGANGNEMFRVSQTGTLRIYVSIPQSAASSVSVGMSAIITIADLPGHEFSGKVAHISGAFDPTTRTLLTDIQLSNEGGKLRPGMFATVRLRNHRDVPPLLVRGDTLIVNASGVSAAVLRDAGHGNGEKNVHIEKVLIGRDYGAETEITSGLQAGDLVVVNPSDEVKEGALVTAVVQNAPGAAGSAGGSGAPRPGGR